MTWLIQPARHLVASTSTACYSCAARASVLRFGFSSSAKVANQYDGLSKESETRQEKDLLEELLSSRQSSRGRLNHGEERYSSSARPTPPPLAVPSWKAHRQALKEKFPDGWNPPRKVGRSEMNVMRRLHGMNETEWSTPRLAETFKISPEAVRRILKSKWKSADELEEEAIGDSLEREAEAPDTVYHSSSNPVTEEGDRFDLPLPDLTLEADEEPIVKKAIPLRAGFKVDRTSKSYKWRKSRRYDNE